MNARASLAALEPYAPRLLLSRLARGVDSEAVEAMEGAVLFADITGFTTLAERLASRGPQGAELLTEAINHEFSRVIALVHEHGGDLIKFAGDAIFVLWPAETSLAAAVIAAGRCGLAIQAQGPAVARTSGARPRLGDSIVEGTEALRWRVGIGAGTVYPMVLGGARGRSEFFVSGEPLVQMGRAERVAAPGEVVLSTEAWTQISAHARGSRLPDRLVRLQTIAPTAPTSESLAGTEIRVEADALRCFVPAAVLSRLDAGQRAWIAEHRPISVLFINLPEIDGVGARSQRLIRELVATTQEHVYKLGGSINKLVMEDRGVILVAAFGLPPQAHENNAERAVRAAIQISDRLRTRAVGHGIGITTGLAFCGTFGGDLRREYSVLGDVVNLAARLVQLAEDEVLCDEATVRACGPRVMSTQLQPVRVKGKAEPVEIFRPTRLRVSTLSPTLTQSAADLVGRGNEQTVLAQRLAELRSGQGGVVVISGEAGLGKSTLLAHLVAAAQALGLASAVGTGSAVESGSPYYAWRPALASWVGRAEEGASARVLALLAEHPYGERWAPLLAEVLGLELRENPVTRNMAGVVRGVNTRALLAHLVRAAVGEAPQLLILDDAHWLDPASWALALAVRRAVPALLLVLAMRPPGDEMPAELAELLAEGDPLHLELGVLSREETDTLVARRLGVTRIDPALGDLLHARAEGHPFFSEELACALRDAGALAITPGSASLLPEAAAGALERLPDTVHGVALSRIDQQTPQQQLTLKVASVVGRVFPYRVIAEIHPVEADRETLPQQCEMLLRRGLLTPERPEPELTYSFKHIVLQQAAYELLAFAQRRVLHRAIAQWYEASHAQDPRHFPLLAHHWRCAEDAPRAIAYLELAGEHAMQQGAVKEAIHCFEQAARLDTGPARDAGHTLRRARWRRQLGQAWSEVGRHDAAMTWLCEGLVLLGDPLPRSNFGFGLRLCTSSLKLLLVWNLLPRGLRPSPGEAKRQRLAEIAHLHSLIGLEYYFATEIFRMLAISVFAVHRAEAARVFAPSSPAYTNVAYLTSMMGLERLSRGAFERCRAGNSRAVCQVSLARSMLALGRGQIDASLAEVDAGIRLAREAGDRQMIATGVSLTGTVYELAGRFEDALRVSRELADEARGFASARFEFWASIAIGTALSLLGRESEALKWISRRESMISEEDTLTAVGVHGIRAHVFLRAGLFDHARVEADLSSTLIRRTGTNVFPHIKALTGIGETYLGLWELTEGRETAALRKAARTACGWLRGFARLFPLARSRAWRLHGRALWLGGKPDAARRAWQRAIAEARALGLAYDEGLALLELGRHAVSGSLERRSMLEAARVVFRRCSAGHDLGRVEQLVDDQLSASATGLAIVPTP